MREPQEERERAQLLGEHVCAIVHDLPEGQVGLRSKAICSFQMPAFKALPKGASFGFDRKTTARIVAASALKL